MQVRSLLATTAATAAVSLLPISAQAATLFSTNGLIPGDAGGIEFDQPTQIRFTLVSANSPSQFYASNLNLYVINQTSGFVDFTSTVPLFRQFNPSGAPSPINSSQDVTFLPGRRYTLGLENFNPSDGTNGLSPIVFFTTRSNNPTNLGPNNSPSNNQQRAIVGYNGPFSEGNPLPNPGIYTSVDPFAGPFLISFEDGGFRFVNGNRVGPDLDFNDFQVRAEVIPAPPLLLGLLAMGARVFFKQRKALKA